MTSIDEIQCVAERVSNGDTDCYIGGRYYYARAQKATQEYWNIHREPDGEVIDTIKGRGPAEGLVRLLNTALQRGREYEDHFPILTATRAKADSEATTTRDPNPELPDTENGGEE